MPRSAARQAKGDGPMQFIVSTDLSRADTKTRQLIRSHVMLGKNRQKAGKGGRAGKKKARTQPAGWTFITVTNQSWNSDLDLVLQVHSASVPLKVGSEFSFVEFADTVDPGMMANLLRMSPLVMQIMFPLAMVMKLDMDSSAWFDLLILDAAYLHVTIFSIEIFVDKALGRPSANPRQVTRHLLRAITLLRERLSLDDEENKVSDSSMGVVLSLAMTANFLGHQEDSKYHMEGLRKMACIRGGIGRIACSKHQMEMMRCDIGVALRNGSPPVFSDACLKLVRDLPDRLVALPQANGTTSSFYHLMMNEFLESIDGELATVWRTMQKFCSLTNSATDNHERIAAVLIRDTMAWTMYQLLGLGFEAGSTTEGIRIGLLLFCHHTFLQWKGVRFSYPQLSASYCTFLSNVENNSTIPSMLGLWLLVIGAISIFPVTEEKWLKVILKGYLHKCSFSDWNEMRQILRSFLWIDMLHDGPGEHIFNYAVS
ncbi:hypothetical protein BX600DRAFT_431279 [Xylariales sp. PMI_506]|nr:hypothetical protein BX600DRAFT_431279 [Xylariales sp. PMI_506]